MKNKKIQNIKTAFYSLIILILFNGCNNSNASIEQILKTNDPDLINQKRKEIIKSQQEIYSKLNLIDDKLEELNANSKFPIVETTILKSNNFQHFVELQGSVKSDQLIIIYPEFSGVLNKIYVKGGEEVTKGQTLATIDDGGLKQKLAQLEISFNLTKTTYERQERLWAQKIGSEIQFLETKSIYEAQKEAIKQLKKQLEKTVIKASFNGTIDNIIAKEGEVVSPGKSNLMILLNMDNMYIECNVPERYINTIYKGKNAKVLFPLMDEFLETSIKQAGNFIDPTKRTYKIKLDLPQNELNIKPNLNAKVSVNDYSNNNAILIKEGFISIDSNNEKYVYKISREEKIAYASKTIVQTGKNNGNYIEVTSGLSVDDEIVVEGMRKLVDNARVKIIK